MGPVRPRLLTDLAKKRRATANNRRHYSSRIYLGKSAEKWNRIRANIGIETSDFIRHLLGVHESLCGCDKHQKEVDKKSPDMDTLRQVVTEPRFLKQFDFFRNFRHMGALEGFNNNILMYAPKRHSYSFIGYRTRNKLAAIDHNHHLHRPEKVDPNGDTVYSKRSQRWRPRTMKQEKNYSYKTDLQLLTFQLKQSEGEGGLKRKTPMDIDDPKLISSTIAKRPCPPIKDLVKDRITRFAKK